MHSLACISVGAIVRWTRRVSLINMMRSILGAFLILLLLIASFAITSWLFVYGQLFAIAASTFGIFFLLATANNAIAHINPQWPKIRMEANDILLGIALIFTW